MKIAIAGTGFSSRQMVLTAQRLGLTVTILVRLGDNTENVDGLGKLVCFTPGMDAAFLFRLLGEPSVITAEPDRADLSVLQGLARYCEVRPGAALLRFMRQRGEQRALLRELEIPTVPCTEVNSYQALLTSFNQFNQCCAVALTKEEEGESSRWLVHAKSDLVKFSDCLWGASLIVEPVLDIEYKIVVSAVRSLDGEGLLYPIAETSTQQSLHGGSRRLLNAYLDEKCTVAKRYLWRLMEYFDFCGIMSIEFYVTEGKILANRVTQSAHLGADHTINTVVFSQFENHIRAIVGRSLNTNETSDGEIAGKLLSMQSISSIASL